MLLQFAHWSCSICLSLCVCVCASEAVKAAGGLPVRYETPFASDTVCANAEKQKQKKIKCRIAWQHCNFFFFSSFCQCNSLSFITAERALLRSQCSLRRRLISAQLLRCQQVFALKKKQRKKKKKKDKITSSSERQVCVCSLVTRLLLLLSASCICILVKKKKTAILLAVKKPTWILIELLEKKQSLHY